MRLIIEEYWHTPGIAQGEFKTRAVYPNGGGWRSRQQMIGELCKRNRLITQDGMGIISRERYTVNIVTMEE